MTILIKKQFREFLKTVGMGDDVTEEMIDEMVSQMSKMLEFDNIGSSINLKTGFLIHQLVLKNPSDVKTELEEQIRKGSFSNNLPPLKFQLTRTCLNLTEDFSCSVLKGWNKSDAKCLFKDNFASCELVQKSVDQGLEELR